MSSADHLREASGRAAPLHDTWQTSAPHVSEEEVGGLERAAAGLLPRFTWAYLHVRGLFAS